MFLRLERCVSLNRLKQDEAGPLHYFGWLFFPEVNVIPTLDCNINANLEASLVILEGPQED